MRLIALLFIASTILAAVPAGASASEDPAATLAPVLFRALSQAQDVPEGWQGVWETTTTLRDCTTNALISTAGSIDTTCANDSFEPGDDEGVLYECINVINSTTVELDCTASFEVIEGCTATLNYDLTSTLSGNTYTATGTVSTTYTGTTCGPLGNSCFKIEVTGTRTASGESVCLTPVEARTWGRIKAQYR